MIGPEPGAELIRSQRTRLRKLIPMAVAEVLAVNGHDVEVGGDVTDLALKGIRGEATLAQVTRQGVGRGHDMDAVVREELPQEHRGHAGLSDVIQLELVDAHQVGRAERVERCLHAEAGDGVRQVGERQVEPLLVRRGMEGCRQSAPPVGISAADATTRAVRVGARPRTRACAAAPRSG